MHKANAFLTLTYSDEQLPPDRSLDVRHWQKFAKDFRYAYGPFRFYHCGEYGDETHRMHLHALIFGWDFTDDRVLFKTNGQGDDLFISKRLTDLWGRGEVVIGDLTHKSAAYCARYTMKRQGGEKGREYYKALAIALTGDAAYERICLETGEVFDGLKPPYSTMSRRPGIGKPWLDKYKTDVYPHDYVVDSSFKKGRPPAFYDNQLDPDQLVDLKAQRVINARPTRKDRTADRLHDREIVCEARTKSLSR